MNHNRFSNTPMRSRTVTATMRKVNSIEAVMSAESFTRGDFIDEFTPFTPDVSTPIAVAVNENGIYVQGTARTRLYDSSGTQLATTASLTSNSPKGGLAFDSSGNVYMCTYHGTGVPTSYYTAINKATSVLSAIPGDWSIAYVGLSPPSTNYIPGIYIGADGYAYIVDRRNKIVRKYTLGGALVQNIGSAGSGTGQFINPQGITADASGNLFIADATRACIVVYSPTGTFIQEITNATVGGGVDLYDCSGLCFDDSGRLYVCLKNASSTPSIVVALDTDYTYLADFTAQGVGEGATNYPVDCAWYNDRLYVCDGSRNKILMFATDTIAGAAVSQSVWYWITNALTELSMGTPDNGVAVPTDHALIQGPRPADIPSGEWYDNSPYLYLVQLRNAVERLVSYDVLLNPATGTAFNWSANDANNLHFVAMTPFLASYNLTTAGYDWKREIYKVPADAMLDLDIGEVYHCVDTLYRAAQLQGLI